MPNTMTFTYQAKSEDNKVLQQRLIALGKLSATNIKNEPNDDGIFGRDTAVALSLFLGTTDPVTVVTQDTFNKLFPRGYHVETSFSLPDWTTGLAKNTIVQYAVVFLGGIIASKFGLDPTSIKSSLPDIINLGIAFIAAGSALWAGIRGAINAAKPKVVAGGNVVPLKAMSVADQQTVASIAAKNAA